MKDQLISERKHVSLLQSKRDQDAGRGNFSSPNTPEEISKAMKQAYWKLVAEKIEQQTRVDSSTSGDKYLNLVKLLSETEATELKLGTDVDEADWRTLGRNLENLARRAGLSDPELSGWNYGASYDWIPTWFERLMGCKQARQSSGQSFIRKRVNGIYQYLLSLASDVKNHEKIKLIIQKDIIDNAQNCADRALTGLDNIEVNIKIDTADNIISALDAVIQKCKKDIIEHILDRSQQEIVEEYLYLAIMFNEFLSLGLPDTEMLYQQCGARKTFDDALGRFLSNISYEGMISMIIKEDTWKDALKRLSSEYQQIEEKALETRDNAAAEDDPDYDAIGQEYNQTIEKAAERITKEIFDEKYLVHGSKYAGITSKHIAEIKQLLGKNDDNDEAKREASLLADITALEHLQQPLHDEVNRIRGLITGANQELENLCRSLQVAEERVHVIANDMMDRGDCDLNNPSLVSAVEERRVAQEALESNKTLIEQKLEIYVGALRNAERAIETDSRPQVTDLRNKIQSSNDSAPIFGSGHYDDDSSPMWRRSAIAENEEDEAPGWRF